MENPTPSLSQQPSDTPASPLPISTPPTNPRPKLIWLAGGITILLLGVAIGAFGVKFLNQPERQPLIASYEDCITAKGSIVQESYPATCVTASDQRFTQPISSPTPESIAPTSDSNASKVIDSGQNEQERLTTDTPVRKIAFSPQTDVNNGGTWRSYSSNTGFSVQYPTYFRISGPEKLSGQKCSVYFTNDVGGFISASVVPYAGGSRRELYGITPGYDYRFEAVFIQDSYKSLIIEKGPIGDSGSGTGVVIPVGNYALILFWTNMSKDTPAFNELLGSIKIYDSLNTNKCGT